MRSDLAVGRGVRIGVGVEPAEAPKAAKPSGPGPLAGAAVSAEQMKPKDADPTVKVRSNGRIKTT